MKNARKEWFTNKRDAKEDEWLKRKQIVLIDTNYEPEPLRRYYAVRKKDLEAIKNLHYTTVSKSFADWSEYEEYRRKFGEENYIYRFTLSSA